MGRFLLLGSLIGVSLSLAALILWFRLHSQTERFYAPKWRGSGRYVTWDEPEDGFAAPWGEM